MPSGIESRIQVIRGLSLMLDMDLAALYGVANCDHLQNLTAPPQPPSLVHMPAHGADEKEAACGFYVATTRATQRMVKIVLKRITE